jgi:hypothetical protein
MQGCQPTQPLAHPLSTASFMYAGKLLVHVAAQSCM